jgi:hypothetical protein
MQTLGKLLNLFKLLVIDMDNKQKKILLIFGTVVFLILMFAIWKSTKHNPIPVIIPTTKNNGTEVNANAEKCTALITNYETYLTNIKKDIKDETVISFITQQMTDLESDKMNFIGNIEDETVDRLRKSYENQSKKLLEHAQQRNVKIPKYEIE